MGCRAELMRIRINFDLQLTQHYVAISQRAREHVHCFPRGHVKFVMSRIAVQPMHRCNALLNRNIVKEIEIAHPKIGTLPEQTARNNFRTRQSHIGQWKLRSINITYT